jgi:guanine nucleotide-binding protein G(i) subunit alpha
MGQCGGSQMSEADKAKMAASKVLEDQMAAQHKKETEKIKLLLLGAGESGKSTVFKQMKVIYGKTFTDSERAASLPTIYSNIINAMKILCDAAATLNMVSQIVASKEYELVMNLDENETITVAIGDAIGVLWKDPGLQAIWDRRAEFQIVDSVRYYFDKIDEIKNPGFLPNQDDILYSRVRTSGIVTESYDIDGTVFEMYDVGGQRNERKKWIHCFEGVTAIIFVAALSEYDQKLFEDASQNRMIEAMDLFGEIINNKFFEKSSIILFLNKRDLFETKILKVHIADTELFADFAGPKGDYDAGVKYFLDKFLSRNKSADRQIYHHTTCATDTKNVRIVFDSCKDIILRENLKNSGFMD